MERKSNKIIFILLIGIFLISLTFNSQNVNSADLKQLAEQLVGGLDDRANNNSNDNSTNLTEGIEKTDIRRGMVIAKPELMNNDNDENSTEDETNSTKRIREGGRYVSIPTKDIIKIARKPSQNGNALYWCPALEDYFDSYTFILPEKKVYNDTFSLLVKEKNISNYSFKIVVVKKNWNGTLPNITIKKDDFKVPEFLYENYTVLNAFIEIKMPEKIEEGSYIVYYVIPVLNNEECFECIMEIKLLYNKGFGKELAVRGKEFSLRERTIALREGRERIVGYDDGTGWKKGIPKNFEEITAVRGEILTEKTLIKESNRMKENEYNKTEKRNETKKIENNNNEKKESKENSEKNRNEKNKENKTITIKNKIMDKITVINKDNKENNVKVKMYSVLNNSKINLSIIKNLTVENKGNKTTVSLTIKKQKKLLGIFNINVEETYRVDDDCNGEECIKVESKTPFWAKWFIKNNEEKNVVLDLLKTIQQ